MSWLLRIALLVMIVLALRWLWRWFWVSGWKRFLQRTVDRVERAQAPPARIGTVEKDPICGTHVDIELAFPETTGGKTIYFCSSHCRETYRARRSTPVGKTG